MLHACINRLIQVKCFTQKSRMIYRIGNRVGWCIENTDDIQGRVRLETESEFGNLCFCRYCG